jgi:hypothetical protein
MRYMRAFGTFWYDFLIGDHVELFLGPLVVLLVVWIPFRTGWAGGIDGFLLFAGITVVGAMSLTMSVRPKR